MDKKIRFSPLTADTPVLPNSIQINANSIKECLKVREILLQASREKKEGGRAGKINSTLYSSTLTKQSETNTMPKTLNTPNNNLGNENRHES